MKKLLPFILLALLASCSTSEKLDNEAYTLDGNTLIVHHVKDGLNIEHDLRFTTSIPASNYKEIRKLEIIDSLFTKVNFDNVTIDYDSTLFLLASQVYVAVDETKEQARKSTSVSFVPESVGEILLGDSIFIVSFVFSCENMFGAPSYVNKQYEVTLENDSKLHWHFSWD